MTGSTHGFGVFSVLPCEFLTPAYFWVDFFVRESKHFIAFYGRTKLDFILPVVLLCYPKIPLHEKRYMPYIRKIWY